ncbi:hypothetical protein HX049_14530 [Myroides odoratimimus]|uniref:hypothetical protein n=1 Tax=Myroides odoratimimus TaxID=76832 RepID=UPI00257859B6|nr:hypothetical protein [Myroides odoratimimus]MDM1398372.1 hypothetical protein [Myroides odoratimimus]
MLDGDFLDKNRKYLGNDGIEDDKVYVVKTTQKVLKAVSHLLVYQKMMQKQQQILLRKIQEIQGHSKMIQ